MENLNKNLFLIKERTGLLKATHNYDILDPETGDVMFECRESNISRLSKFFRLLNLTKGTTPFDITVSTANKEQVIRITRGVPIFASSVKVKDENNNRIGIFQQRLISFSGAFDILDAKRNSLCELKGNRTGRNYQFLAPGDIELARTSKQWEGLGKELLTGSNCFMLEIDDSVPENSSLRQLILASALCIGIILKVEVP